MKKILLAASLWCACVFGDATENAAAEAARAARNELAGRAGNLAAAIKTVKRSGALVDATAIASVDMALSELESARASLLGSDSAVAIGSRGIVRSLNSASEYLGAVSNNVELAAAAVKLGNLTRETGAFLEINYGDNGLVAFTGVATPVSEAGSIMNQITTAREAEETAAATKVITEKRVEAAVEAAKAATAAEESAESLQSESQLPTAELSPSAQAQTVNSPTPVAAAKRRMR
ncbi:MAG: hypothetical protein LBO73_04255 [Holosporaceae bacterium]|jgi:hypothetical protein|nr:hypothetical protein [Holosporaceae bacterium]